MALQLPGTKLLLKQRTAGGVQVLSIANEKFIQDNFRGNDLNSFLWDTETVGSGTVIQRNGMCSLNSGTAVNDSAMLKCLWGGNQTIAPNATYTVTISFRKNINTNADGEVFIGFAGLNDDPASMTEWEGYHQLEANTDTLINKTVTDAGTYVGEIESVENDLWTIIKLVVVRTQPMEFYINGTLMDTLTTGDLDFMGFKVWVRCKNASNRALTLDINWVKIEILNPVKV